MKIRILLALAMMLITQTTYGMGAIRAAISNFPPVVVTNTPPIPPSPPEPPEPVPESAPPVVTNTPAPTPSPSHPFVGRKVKTERIAKDILNWKETAHISKASWKGSTLTTSGSFPKWPCKMVGSSSMQGNFGLAVEQPDGSIVIGTWDWDRCGHQEVKSAGNNLNSTGEHKFFNLRSGCRIWWFITGLSRDSKRNVEERSNFYPDVWK